MLDEAHLGHLSFCTQLGTLLSVDVSPPLNCANLGRFLRRLGSLRPAQNCDDSTPQSPTVACFPSCRAGIEAGRAGPPWNRHREFARYCFNDDVNHLQDDLDDPAYHFAVDGPPTAKTMNYSSRLHPRAVATASVRFHRTVPGRPRRRSLEAVATAAFQPPPHPRGERIRLPRWRSPAPPRPNRRHTVDPSVPPLQANPPRAASSRRPAVRTRMRGPPLSARAGQARKQAALSVPALRRTPRCSRCGPAGPCSLSMPSAHPRFRSPCHEATPRTRFIVAYDQ